MRMTEVLICILMFVLLAVGLMESYTVANKNKDKIVMKTYDSDFIITTDYKIRRKIWEFNIPYWKNIQKEFSRTRDYLFLHLSTDEIFIQDIQLIDDKIGFYKVKVTWKYKDQEFETIEHLNVKQIIK